MIWDIQKYNQEKKLLRKLSQDAYLDPLRKESIKKDILAAIEQLPESAHPVFASPNGFVNIIKGFAPAMAILLFLTGTAFAANESLPGDILYPVKRAIEEVELKLAPTHVLKAALAEHQAFKRLDEIDLLSVAQAETTEPQPSEATAIPNPEHEMVKDHFESALNTLDSIKGRLEVKGKLKAVEKISDTIERLKARAETTGLLSSELPVQPILDTPSEQIRGIIQKVVPPIPSVISAPVTSTPSSENAISNPKKPITNNTDPDTKSEQPKTDDTENQTTDTPVSESPPPPVLPPVEPITDLPPIITQPIQTIIPTVNNTLNGILR